MCLKIKVSSDLISDVRLLKFWGAAFLSNPHTCLLTLKTNTLIVTTIFCCCLLTLSLSLYYSTILSCWRIVCWLS